MIRLTDEAQAQIIKICREVYDLGIRLEVVSGVVLAISINFPTHVWTKKMKT